MVEEALNHGINFNNGAATAASPAKREASSSCRVLVAHCTFGVVSHGPRVLPSACSGTAAAPILPVLPGDSDAHAWLSLLAWCALLRRLLLPGCLCGPLLLCAEEFLLLHELLAAVCRLDAGAEWGLEDLLCSY